MDTVDFTRFILAFLFVIGLIGACGFWLKRYGNAQKLFGISPEGGRIGVVETRYLGPRHRLLLVRRDEVEHLILLSADRELLIESIRKEP